MKVNKTLHFVTALAFALASCAAVSTPAPQTPPATPTQVAAPTFSPPPGLVSASTCVRMTSSTAGASIEYWTDLDPVPKAGASLILAQACTVYAKASEQGDTDSDVVSASYTVTAANQSAFHGQAVDVYEDFEDDTLAPGLTWEHVAQEGTDITLSSTDCSHDGAASLKINHGAMSDQANVIFFAPGPAPRITSRISAGFWVRCPTLSSDGTYAEVANPTDQNYQYILQLYFERVSGSIFIITSWNSDSCAVTQGNWYWCAYLFDAVGGTNRLNVYADGPDHSLLFSTTTPVPSSQTSMSELTLGVEMAETLPGTVVYYDDYAIDYTNAAFPIRGWDAAP